MMSYTVLLHNDEEKDIFIHCQQLDMMLRGKVARGACYPYTLEQAYEVARKGEILGCWK